MGRRRGKGSFLGLKSILSDCCDVCSKKSITASAWLLQLTAMLLTGQCHINFPPWKICPPAVWPFVKILWSVVIIIWRKKMCYSCSSTCVLYCRCSEVRNCEQFPPRPHSDVPTRFSRNQRVPQVGNQASVQLAAVFSPTGSAAVQRDICWRRRRWRPSETRRRKNVKFWSYLMYMFWETKG